MAKLGSTAKLGSAAKTVSGGKVRAFHFKEEKEKA